MKSMKSKESSLEIAENLKQLRRRIGNCFKNLDSEAKNKLFASFTRVDAVRRNGLQNL